MIINIVEDAELAKDFSLYLHILNKKNFLDSNFYGKRLRKLTGLGKKSYILSRI